MIRSKANRNHFNFTIEDIYLGTIVYNKLKLKISSMYFSIEDSQIQVQVLEEPDIRMK